jgi:hypothetical protein
MLHSFEFQHSFVHTLVIFALRKVPHWYAVQVSDTTMMPKDLKLVSKFHFFKSQSLSLV